MRYHPCPKCNRRIAQSGELTIEGRSLAVFQCDECLETTRLMGVPVEVALTFAIDEDGQEFDLTKGSTLG